MNKSSPLDLALQQLMGLQGGVMDKRLQALAMKRQGGDAAASPDAQTDADAAGGTDGMSDEELAKRLSQYCGE